MQIDTMKIFCDLVELQNFSRTAEKHGISQSAVSQQIAQLEVKHHCQLISRKSRPLTPTKAGELFYHACKDILERYDRLSSELSALQKSSLQIKLAAIFSIGMHTLQPYVRRFMEMYPKVNLSVEYCAARQIYDGILKGSFDVGVVAVPRMDRNIEVLPFENERLLLVCSRQHGLAAESTVDIHQLQGADFIAFAEDVPSRTLIDNILRQHSVNVRIVMEFDNTETIKRAVEINSGVSVLPEPTIAHELAGGTLRGLPFRNQNFYRPTGVILRKNRMLPQAGRYLIELLQKKLDDEL